jgi:hypothetical protein
LKVFVSSVIRDFSEFRAAACEAVQSLGLEVVRAEDFVASPASPQITCLSGVRQSDIVVLVLGERYGALQTSGLSATHEEFNEAKDTKPVFVFVQINTTPEPRQRDFIAEVQAWATGSYTGPFVDAAGLRSAVTTALHRWALSRAAGGVDLGEVATRAIEALPHEQRGYSSNSGPAISISLAGAPRQSILRPSELEADSFQRELTKRALFGEPNIFSTAHGVDASVSGHSLRLIQGNSSLIIDEEGAILLTLELPKPEGFFAPIIEEDVRDTLTSGLQFIARLLDYIDDTERISHVALAINLTNISQSAWRTRREHEKSPDRMTMSHFMNEAREPILLSPPHRSRAALRQQTTSMAEDFTVLLRRSMNA